jgi:RimJ/RimL family protein N-acetyltransferase
MVFVGMNTIAIREATANDSDAVREFLERLSPDARWLRYHSPAPIIRSWMVDAVVRADHEHREALLALDGDRIVGIAEWGRIDEHDRSADVGIVVDECCRRRGIARRLLRRLGANALQHGVDTFETTVLSTNRPTIALTQRVGVDPKFRFEGPTVSVTIPLSPAS